MGKALDHCRQAPVLARTNERPRLTGVRQPEEAQTGRESRSTELFHPDSGDDGDDAEQHERRSKKYERVRQPVRHTVEPVEEGSWMPGARTRRAPRRDTDTAKGESQESKAQNKSRLLESGPLLGNQKRADAIERVVQNQAPKDEPPEAGAVSPGRRCLGFLRRAHGDSRSIELTKRQDSAETRENLCKGWLPLAQRREVDGHDPVHGYSLPVERRGLELVPPHSPRRLHAESVAGLLENDRVLHPSAFIDDESDGRNAMAASLTRPRGAPRRILPRRRRPAGRRRGPNRFRVGDGGAS